MLHITETYNPNSKVISRNCKKNFKNCKNCLFWKCVLIFRCSTAFCKTQRCSIKKMFLTIFENLQENICVWVSFNKVAGLGLQLYWKKHSGAGAFLWTLQNFQENLFYKISLADYFCMLSSLYGFGPYNWTWSLTIVLKFSFLIISYNIVQKEREEQTSPSGL